MIELGEAASASWENGEVRDISHEMMQLTLRIVARTLFSANIDDRADEVGNAMTTVTELFNFLRLPFSELLQKLPITHTLRFNRARRVFNSVIYRMNGDRRVSGEDPGDLLAMLLAARDEDDATAMTDEQVRDEALTLFLAGHETTANALTWTWYLLAGNPAKREKLFAELDDVLGGREPSYDDLPNLKSSETVVAESLRLFPRSWTLGRLSIQDHELGGYFVPTGSLILASQFVIHRDGRFWDAPDAFLPERWETVSVKEAGQQYTCFPFGAGVRRCIGESFAWAEGILLLAVIARRWTFELEPDQPFGLHPMITLRPKYPMLMRIIRR
jgi:cytochrome P450